MTDEPDAAARYADAVLARSRAGIARTITLVESSRPDHRVLAQYVLTRLLPHAGPAKRVGITGVPGRVRHRAHGAVSRRAVSSVSRS